MAAADPRPAADPPPPAGHRAAERAGRSGAMAFVRGLFGSAAMLVAARGVEILFFGAGFYATLAQQPFWIIVHLAAMLEGLYVGVATAAMAALLMDWPVRPVGVDITAHYIDVAILPLQWLMAAICIGIYRQIELRRQREAADQQAGLAAVNAALVAEVGRLDGAVRKMELAAATLGQSELKTGAARLVALRFAGPAELAAQFAGAAAAVTDQPCALLLVQKNRLVQAAGPEIAGIELPCGSRSRLYKSLDHADGGALLGLTVPDDPSAVFAGAAIRDPGGALVGAVVLRAPNVDKGRHETRALATLAAMLARPVPRRADEAADPEARRGNLVVVGGRGE